MVETVGITDVGHKKIQCPFYLKKTIRDNTIYLYISFLSLLYVFDIFYILQTIGITYVGQREKLMSLLYKIMSLLYICNLEVI